MYLRRQVRQPFLLRLFAGRSCDCARATSMAAVAGGVPAIPIDGCEVSEDNVSCIPEVMAKGAVVPCGRERLSACQGRAT